ncbi:CCT_1a_G0037110.mRNA.1.CDS.1 [Saccharomyces cerevisiae]|nr:CCT_1a_G0037110.mRNA.1.CDS.1 [Saccharomyces cerevisiae]CAI7410008.1 CCT_1a_G0037110.mRNA.1.CDS.1 [Saccharomyces cerevisiae]
MTTGRINQITILKEEATNGKKKDRNLFFFSHLFPLARRYLLSLETAEIPEKLLFQVSLLPEMLSVQKAFTLLTSALRHHTIALFGFPSNQVPPNRYPGVSRNGTFDIADLRGGYT